MTDSNPNSAASSSGTITPPAGIRIKRRAAAHPVPSPQASPEVEPAAPPAVDEARPVIPTVETNDDVAPSEAPAAPAQETPTFGRPTGPRTTVRNHLFDNSDTDVSATSINSVTQVSNLLPDDDGPATSPEAPNAANHSAPRRHLEPRSFKVDRGIDWKEIDPFPNRSDRLDAWFIAYERLMRSKNVARIDWGCKFMECPRANELLKTRIQAKLDSFDYSAIREWCLRHYGPPFPVGYHRWVLHQVKGTSREEVVEKLEDAFILLNRACDDYDVPRWSECDMLHPFVQAFAEPIRSQLLKHLPSCILAEDPWTEIQKHAPSKQSDAEIKYVAATSLREPPATSQDIIAALQETVKSMVDLVRPAKQARKDCPGCGGICVDRESCPARNKACNRCGILNHFGSVCRSNQNAQRPRNGNNGNNKFQRNNNNSFRPRGFNNNGNGNGNDSASTGPPQGPRPFNNNNANNNSDSRRPFQQRPDRRQPR